MGGSTGKMGSSCHVNLQKVGPGQKRCLFKPTSLEALMETLNGAPAVLSRLFKDSLKNWAGNLRTTHLSSTGQAFFNFP